MLTLLDELSYFILYFPRASWHVHYNHMAELSYPSYPLCLLTRVDPEMILVIKTCSTVLHLGVFSFDFDAVSFSAFPHTGSTQCNPKTDRLCNVTFNFKEAPSSIGRRMERPEGASVSHCRVRCVLLCV